MDSNAIRETRGKAASRSRDFAHALQDDLRRCALQDRAGPAFVQLLGAADLGVVGTEHNNGHVAQQDVLAHRTSERNSADRTYAETGDNRIRRRLAGAVERLLRRERVDDGGPSVAENSAQKPVGGEVILGHEYGHGGEGRRFGAPVESNGTLAFVARRRADKRDPGRQRFLAPACREAEFARRLRADELTDPRHGIPHHGEHGAALAEVDELTAHSVINRGVT